MNLKKKRKKLSAFVLIFVDEYDQHKAHKKVKLLKKYIILMLSSIAGHYFEELPKDETTTYD